MSDRRPIDPRTTRRATLGALATVATVGPTFGAEITRASSGSEIVLGDFEGSYDGWETNGGNDLVTVPRSKRPGGVTRGERALDVYVNGDAYPMIERDVGSVDFQSHPYLVADVTPGMIAETGTNVSFTFRLYYDDGSTGAKPAPQLSSPTVSIPETIPGQVFWDLSDVGDSRLSDARRLELAWHATGEVPSGGPRGWNGGANYLGRVTIDNVRLSSGEHAVAAARLSDRLRTLTFEHGPVEETIVDSRMEGSQEGTFVFGDETERSYAIDVQTDGRVHFTLGETTYELEVVSQ